MPEIAWDVLAWAADAALVALFYAAYRKATRQALAVKSAPEYEVSNKLQEVLEQNSTKSVPYACVTGNIEPVGTALHSYYKDKQGVIQKLTLVEHRTKRTQGYWSDCKRVLRDAVNIAPFKLVSPNQEEAVVLVTEPLAAEQILENLTTTFDRFEPNKSTVLERGIDRVFGDVSKGFQETEKMLDVGIQLYGIGKLVLDGNVIKILPPEGGEKYILTRLTKSEVVKVLQSRAKVMKILTVIFGVIGMGMFTYWAYKKVAHLKEKWQMERAMAEFRAMRTQAASSNGDNEEESRESCVICINNPKNVVILDCGHICICSECASILPEPRICPVCRQNVARVLPIYAT